MATAVATACLFPPHFRPHFSRPTVSRLRLCSVLAWAGAVGLVWPIRLSAQLSHTTSSTRLTALIPHLPIWLSDSHTSQTSPASASGLPLLDSEMPLFSDSDSPSRFMFRARIFTILPLMRTSPLSCSSTHLPLNQLASSSLPIGPSLASILYTRPCPLRHSPASSLCSSFQLYPFSDRSFSSSTPLTRDQTQGLHIAIGVPLYRILLCLFLASTNRRNKRQRKTFLSIPGQPPFGLPNIEQ